MLAYILITTTDIFIGTEMWRSSVRAWRSTPVKVRDLCSFFSRVSRPYHVRKYSDMVGLTPSLSHPLRGEKMRQFLTSDKETIVCVHSTAPVDISGTKVQLFNCVNLQQFTWFKVFAI